MNKADLILEVADRVDASKVETEAVIEEFLSLITKELVAGNEVKLSGFGIFNKKAKAARKGTNPSNGSIITIKACNTVSFKPSKTLKAKVN